MIKEALETSKIEEIEDVTGQSEKDKEAFRAFDREVRIQSFMFHSWAFSGHVIRKHFGSDLSESDSHFHTCKTKFKDNVRTQKHQMLKHLEDNLKEIRDNMPGVWNLDDDSFRDRLFDQLNQSTFHFVWYYLTGIISLKKSAALGQFYIRSKQAMFLIFDLMLTSDPFYFSYLL